MARPSKRQLACRNANNIKKQKAKERRETGGLAPGPSQTRDIAALDHSSDRDDAEREEDVEQKIKRPPPEASKTSATPAPPKSCVTDHPAPKPFQYPSGPSYSSPNYFLNSSSPASPQSTPPNPSDPPPPTSPPHQPPPPPNPPAIQVSTYNFTSGKPVCRQTLWRRRKRALAQSLNPIPPTPPEPDPAQQHREELTTAITKWPRVTTTKLKEDILDSAISDMEKLLKSKIRRPKGQDLNRHEQVLHFMNIQRMNIQHANRTNTPRMDLALTVANTYRKGREVADRIVRHEKEWIKKRVIPAGAQGKNAKVPSMLEDEGTVRFIRGHIDRISATGDKLTASGLAVAVLAYWRGVREDGGEVERRRELTLSSRTASTWLGKLGYVYEDGAYRFKGVQPVIAPPQEGGAGGYL